MKSTEDFRKTDEGFILDMSLPYRRLTISPDYCTVAPTCQISKYCGALLPTPFETFSTEILRLSVTTLEPGAGV